MDLTFSSHAQKRMAERSISLADIEVVLLAPVRMEVKEFEVDTMASWMGDHCGSWSLAKPTLDTWSACTRGGDSHLFVTYDSQADALSVRLADPDIEVAETDDVVDARIMVDYDAAGGVIGVEILGATRSLDLTGVPEADRVAEAIRSPRHLAAV